MFFFKNGLFRLRAYSIPLKVKDLSLPLDYVNFFYTLRIIVSLETYLLTVKELELTEGKATRISAVLKSLEDNWSPLPKFNTDEDRSFFEIALFIRETMAGGSAEKLKHSA